MSSYQKQWLQLQEAIQKNRIPQAMFFVSPIYSTMSKKTGLSKLIIDYLQVLFCQQKEKKACLQCSDCQMVALFEHPDAEWIRPEKKEGAIKIDQIRALQHSAFLTPKRGNYRVIVIEAADKMNTAAANALLKILEEPAQHTKFILMGRQLNSILPTVLSRCQIYNFPQEQNSTGNLLQLGLEYPPDSDQALIMQQAESVLDDLIQLLEGRQHPCILATQWSKHEASILLWFLYLVYAQVQQMHFNYKVIEGPATSQLLRLKTLLGPVSIFQQLDKINILLRKISHNIHVNYTLALEDLLFSLLQEEHL